MAHGLALFGLVLALIGSGLFAWGEITTGAAQIRWWYEQHPQKELRGGPFKRRVFRAARRWGSSGPFAMQAYVSESFPEKVAGFVLLVLGFAFQAAGVLVDFVRSHG